MGGEGRVRLSGDALLGGYSLLCDIEGVLDGVCLESSKGFDSGGDIRLAIDGSLIFLGSSIIILRTVEGYGFRRADWVDEGWMTEDELIVEVNGRKSLGCV